jgi:hypothetical protein
MYKAKMSLTLAESEKTLRVWCAVDNYFSKPLGGFSLEEFDEMRDVDELTLDPLITHHGDYHLEDVPIY